MKKDMSLPEETIFRKIYVVRGQKVMLDADLSELYGVETKRLKQSVRRNIERFPSDFMFELTIDEWKTLRSQIVSLNDSGQGHHIKYLPFAFTEQGVAMLSGVLKSPRAISVNIHIMRIFVKMRQLITGYKELLEKVEQLENSQAESDAHIANIYKLIKEYFAPKEKNEGRLDSKSPQTINDKIRVIRVIRGLPLPPNTRHMKTIFNTADLNELITRIDKLKPDTQRHWGSMDPARMFAHCSSAVQLALGELDPHPPRVFIGRLLGGIARKSLYKEGVFPKNSATYKGFVISDPRDFEKEKNTLLAELKRFHEAGEKSITQKPHPFFGKLTPQEWGQLQWKHLNHHLKQFGV